MLQPFPDFKKDIQQGLRERLAFEKAWNKVTDLTPMELSFIFKWRYEWMEERLAAIGEKPRLKFCEFMSKKAAWIRGLVAMEEKQLTEV